MSQDETRILIIDDEAAIRSLLKSSLESHSYETKEAITAKAGLIQAKDFHPHLILLDLGLPDMNGLEVLKELRSWTQIPIIILTVTDDEAIKVRLLDAGADDYLTKPFGTHELLARVRVALRHRGHEEATPIFRSGDLEVNLSERKVSVNGEVVKLTSTEFEVLTLLVRDHGKVIPQAQIMKKVWGILAEEQSHYLRIYINQLRKKIEVNTSEPKHILTEPGVGYRLV
ncbi:MAG: response regulator [Bdellovibrio sp.]|nr:response regulator [Bdellovibrio sp.]